MNNVKAKGWLVAWLVFATVGSVVAQSTGAFNGRVTDPAGAILPGATVVATNVGTGIQRNTVSNSDGLYTIPAVEPGIYEVKATSTGFATTVRRGVNLVVGTTMTLDFQLTVASVSQEVQVTAGTQTIDTTESKVAASIETSQVQNLPMLNRNFQGLVELLPGARPISNFPTKQTMGAVSFSGGSISTMNVVVDGAENRDDLVGGPLMDYTNESIDEFTVMIHQFSAQYNHSTGAVMDIVTKSGSNQFHGTAFGLGRSDALTSIDYFTQISGAPKTPYDREQYGGSFGGPIKKDRAFFFVALERPQQDSALTIPTSVYTQMADLQTLDTLGNLGPLVGTNTIPEHSISMAYRDMLSDAKLDVTLNSRHSLMFRFSDQNNTSANDQFSAANHDLLAPTQDENSLYSGVARWMWTISPTKLNSFSFQYNHDWNVIDAITPEFQPPVIDSLIFPAFSTGRASLAIRQNNRQNKLEGRDDFTIQLGKHAVKMGIDYMNSLQWGGLESLTAPGNITFFANPSVILASYQQWQANPAGCTVASCGSYRQGLSTIGAVSSITETSSVLGDYRTPHVTEEGAYIQDDWRIKPRLTLNLGLRYDVSPNFYNTSEMDNNRAYLVLKAIGSPYAKNVPQTPTNDFQPRVGFAWDVGGSGRHVVRGGYGIFFAQSIINYYFPANVLNKPELFLSETFSNTGAPGNPGSGIFSTYQYGLTPLPVIPATPTNFLPGQTNITGYVESPNLKDPNTEQFHIGYENQFSAHTTLSVDYTHYLGLHENYASTSTAGTGQGLETNPIEGAWDPNAAQYNTCGAPAGSRRLYCQLVAAGYPGNFLGSVPIISSADREHFNEIAVQFRQHFYKNSLLGVDYTYSRDYTWLVPQDPDSIFTPANYGPAANDVPNTLSIFGVTNLPFGIQLSPVVQTASGRPYNLTEGLDVYHDGVSNALYINPSTGKTVTPDSIRGNALFVADLRGTKFFSLSKDGVRKIGVFAELYNITNRANFGSAYNGACSAKVAGGPCSNVNFEQPNGYIPGLGYTRQLQLGARFYF